MMVSLTKRDNFDEQNAGGWIYLQFVLFFFPVQTKYVTTGLGLIVNLFLFCSYHPRDSFQQFFSEVIYETSPKTNAPTNTPSQRSVPIHEQLP